MCSHPTLLKLIAVSYLTAFHLFHFTFSSCFSHYIDRNSGAFIVQTQVGFSWAFCCLMDVMLKKVVYSDERYCSIFYRDAFDGSYGISNAAIAAFVCCNNMYRDYIVVRKLNFY